MPNLNRVLLMGNLTRDPEMRYLPSNTPVVAIALAINRRWKNQQGEPQEEVLFIDCEGFGRTAEVINQYMKKGQPLFVEGRLRLDQWQDKEGHPRSKMKVVIENFQFLGGREGAGNAAAGGGAAANASGARSTPYPGAAPAPSTAAPPGAIPPDAGHQPIEEEDIPF
jgi:single-strand DNA-binding protein